MIVIRYIHIINIFALDLWIVCPFGRDHRHPAGGDIVSVQAHIRSKIREIDVSSVSTSGINFLLKEQCFLLFVYIHGIKGDPGFLGIFDVIDIVSYKSQPADIFPDDVPALSASVVHLEDTDGGNGQSAESRSRR